jgi:hypothetical protein
VKRVFIAAGLLLVLQAPEARAAGTRPDPASVTIPDLSSASDPSFAAQGWKYFFFHKQGISFDKAYSDFEECFRFLPVPNVSVSLPMFAPWDEKPGVKDLGFVPNNYGLMGAVIGELIAGPLERRAHQSRMRLCLETRGYVRYPLSKAAWERLIDVYSEQSIAMQATAASGPKPRAVVVTR